MKAFRFKEFSVKHARSSMKVGVDAVLLGAWADVSNVRRALDVGCGCGVIALQVSQRAPEALVEAIDVHEPSVIEAAGNFRRSPWSRRLEARLLPFEEYTRHAGELDLIVSNPPYFTSGIAEPDTPRLRARHAAGLSPTVLLESAPRLLAPDGRLTMVVPAEGAEPLLEHARAAGMHPLRLCRVRGHYNAPYKRLLCEFAPGDANGAQPEVTELTLEESPGHRTADYTTLCHAFYLDRETLRSHLRNTREDAPAEGSQETPADGSRQASADGFV